MISGFRQPVSSGVLLEFARMTTESTRSPKPVLIKALSVNESSRSSEQGSAGPVSKVELLNTPFGKHLADHFGLNANVQPGVSVKNTGVTTKISQLLLKI